MEFSISTTATALYFLVLLFATRVTALVGNSQNSYYIAPVFDFREEF